MESNMSTLLDYRRSQQENEVHLLKVAENDAAVEYDSPLKKFEAFSENDKCLISNKKNSDDQQGNGYKLVHEKFFFNERNVLNRKTLGDNFKFKMKKSSAVKEACKLGEKMKYINILENVSSNRNFRNDPWTAGWGIAKRLTNKQTNISSYRFSALKTPNAGITREKADTKKMNNPGYKNSLEVVLQNNPVYSPMFLQELREKFDRKHREVDKKIAEEKIKRKFYEDKKEETQEELEERIMKHMKMTQAYVEDVDTSDEEEEELELPVITPEMEEVIRSAKQSEGQVLVDSHNIQITRNDIDTLNGLNWINDNIINFYLQMIVERSAQKGLKVYATNTFFYPKMMSSGQSDLKRWTKQVDIFELDVMLIPVHHLCMRWCLAVVDFRKPGVYYYDSMGDNNRQCLTSLLKYLKDEHRDKKGEELDVERFERKIVKDIPQQMNGSDGGIFACKFAEYISRGAPFTFSQQDMPYFRRRMIWEIVKDTLLYP